MTREGLVKSYGSKKGREPVPYHSQTPDRELVRRFAILVSVPRVSTITAVALLIDMPELGTLENGQATSLAGPAPVARSVGQGNWTHLHSRWVGQ